MITIAIPNKGRLYEPTIELLNKSGIKIDLESRKLYAKTSHKNIHVIFIRARDIPEIVYSGTADLGITGYDILVESGLKLNILLKLGYGRAKLVVACREEENPEEIFKKNRIRVATEFPKITYEHFKRKGMNIEIIKVSGATEIMPLIGVSDLIVDLVTTGNTLRMNKLKIVDEILETEACLIANENSLKNKREEIEEIMLLLQGVINARNKKLVMMNVPENILEEIKKIMPGLAGPTVARVLSKEPMYAVHAVVDEEDVYEVIIKAKKIGARDILVVPIERLIP